jgi:hypothetical protein
VGAQVGQVAAKATGWALVLEQGRVTALERGRAKEMAPDLVQAQDHPAWKAPAR